MPLPNQEVFNLHQYRNIVGDPARPYLFLVVIPEIANDTVTTGMARSTSLPEYQIGEVNIPFQGLNVKIASTPTFNDWMVQFTCDEAHELRRIFLQWQALAYDVGTGTTGHSNQYKSDQLGVAQLNRQGKAIAKYGFVGAWPKTVGAINVGQDQNADYEKFDVTFSYDYFILVNEFGEQTKPETMVRSQIISPERGNSPNFGGNFKPK